jgi:hypothetical protein
MLTTLGHVTLLSVCQVEAAAAAILIIIIIIIISKHRQESYSK